eukprot:gene16957-biopygen9826
MAPYTSGRAGWHQGGIQRSNECLGAAVISIFACGWRKRWDWSPSSQTALLIRGMYGAGNRDSPFGPYGIPQPNHDIGPQSTMVVSAVAPCAKIRASPKNSCNSPGGTAATTMVSFRVN